MNPKAVLFDLDGTLLDTAPEFVDCLNILLAEQGQPSLTLEKIRPSVSHGSVAVLKTGFNLEEHDPKFGSLKQRFLDIYLNNIGSNTHYFAGIETLLNTLEKSGIKWGIVTNKPHFLTQALLDKLDITKRANVVVSGDTLSVSKPSPLPILFACEQINIAPHDCYYVGDAQRDIMAGKASGMLATFMAMYGYLGPQDKPLEWKADHYIQHPNEILSPRFSMG